MTASQASGRQRRRPGPRLSAALVLAAGLALAGAPGVAAQGANGRDSGAGPIPLFPPTVVPGPSPTEEGPAEEGPTGEAPGGPPPATPEWPSDPDIEINRLGEPDAESLGVLDAGHGGLGADAWAGSERGRVEALLRDMPGDLASPTLRRLAARLLLSSARAPASAGPQGAQPTVADAVAAAQETSFLRLRAERLYALGELAGLNRLLGLVPRRIEDPWLAEAQVDGLLMAGRAVEACDQVPAGLARYPQSLYWAKAQVFCQFAAERTDQALLGLDLLREQAPDSDPAFFRLANALAAGTDGELAPGELTPLTLAMLRETGGSLSPEAVAAVDGLLLHGIAALPGGEPAVRAAAVERLVEVGALPGQRLAGAYDAFEFTEAELGDALAEAERVGGVRARALLYRAASRESLDAARAEILRAAFLAAEADGLEIAMARAVAPLLAQLAPTQELAWFAPLATRTLYRAGQYERAGAWLSVLRLDGQRHPESQQAYETLRPLLRLAGGAEPLSGDSLSGSQRLLLFVLSRALGQDEDIAWLAAGDDTQGRRLERLPHLLGLADAAVAGRRGETVLLTVDALGAAAPAESDPLALGYAVSGLRAIGLGNDARSLALEAALAAGL